MFRCVHKLFANILRYDFKLVETVSMPPCANQRSLPWINTHKIHFFLLLLVQKYSRNYFFVYFIVYGELSFEPSDRRILEKLNWIGLGKTRGRSFLTVSGVVIWILNSFNIVTLRVLGLIWAIIWELIAQPWW